MTTFQIRDLDRVPRLNPGVLWRTIAAVEENLTPTRSYPLAVIMERAVLSNRWASEQWSAIGVVRDTRGGEPRVARLVDVPASAARSDTLLERPMSATNL